MREAISFSGKAVRADEAGMAYSFDLRCPSCGERVFFRKGSLFREPHFAHYAGRRDRDCDLYFPGDEGTGVAPSRSESMAEPHIGGPTLFWRDSVPIPVGLYLRLPRLATHAEGLARVISRATTPFLYQDLTTPKFVCVQLATPPAGFETYPADEGLNAAVAEAMAEFRLTGNYFRATVEGGILERVDAPLVIGERYWLVTQSRLRTPMSKYIHVESHRTDRAWHVYGLKLAANSAEYEDAIAEVGTHLGRRVETPRGRVQFVWPAAGRFDLDGTPVFDESVSSIIVRCHSGTPKARFQDGFVVSAQPLGEGLHAIAVTGRGNEGVAMAPGGDQRRFRLAQCEASSPHGVKVKGPEVDMYAFEPGVVEITSRMDKLILEVPSTALWRKMLLNGSLIRPLPDGTDYAVAGSLTSLYSGSFGSFEAAQPITAPDELSAWPLRIGQLIELLVGRRALESFRKNVRSKGHLVQWANDFQAQALLPKLLSEYPSGEPNDIS